MHDMSVDEMLALARVHGIRSSRLSVLELERALAPFLPLPVVAMTPGEHVGSWNVFRLSPLARGGTGESATEHNVPTGDLAPDAVAWLRRRNEESER